MQPQSTRAAFTEQTDTVRTRRDATTGRLSVAASEIRYTYLTVGAAPRKVGQLTAPTARRLVAPLYRDYAAVHGCTLAIFAGDTVARWTVHKLESARREMGFAREIGGSA